MEVINMPRGDGTGPIGYGPGTGRGAGFCTGSFGPGYMAKPCFSYGRSYGKRFGRGHGYQYWFQDTGYPEFTGHHRCVVINDDTAEKEQFQRQAEILEKQLNYVNRRLSALKQDD
jgi:hypothetical protein